jgi:hypothetical protein
MGNVKLENSSYFRDQVALNLIGSHFFDAPKLQHINCGRMWRANVEYSHFFWEAWVKPYYSGSGSWTGYVVSDNEGGNHNLLWGCAMGSDGMYNITGNIHNGTTLTSFSSVAKFPANEWAHWAVGWDGSHIMLWVNGILIHLQAYSSGRKQPGGNNFCLHIGGSDHNNFWGNIAPVRGYEGYGRCLYINDFTPERYFRTLSASSTAMPDVPQFFINLQTPGRIFRDLSGGFENVKHDGVPSAVISVQGAGEQSPAFKDYDLPEFQAGDIEIGLHVPTPPATPTGALVFDSFSRADVTSLNCRLFDPETGDALFGSTEAGTLGPLLWVSDSVSFPNAQGEILSGHAVMPYNGVSQLVQTSTQNVDIRVDRPLSALCNTSIYFRYKDANDYYAVWGNDNGLTLRKRESGVTTDVPITVSAGWKALRVVANGTTCTIYTGTALEGTFTSVATPTITNVAGATKHGLYNSQNNTKSVYMTDNFLIKAA